MPDVSTLRLLALAVVASSACGGNVKVGQDQPLDAGTPVATGTSGTSSSSSQGSTSGGTGGSGTVGDDSCVVGIRCLNDLRATILGCMGSGSCVSEVESTDPLVVVNMCWANGYKARVTTNSNDTLQTITFTGPDGSTCASFDESRQSPDPPNPTIVYKDGSGQVLATVAVLPDGTTIECPGSPPVMVPPSCDSALSPMGMPTPNTSCTVGTCR